MMIAILFGLVTAIVPLLFLWAAKEGKKCTLSGSLLLLGLFGATVLCMFGDRHPNTATTSYRGNDLFASITYRGKSGDYYLLHEAGFLSGGTDIAVPQSSAECSWLLDWIPDAYISYPTGANYWTSENEIEIGGKTYMNGSAITAIKPFFFPFHCMLAVTYLCVLLCFWVICLVEAIMRRMDQKRAGSGMERKGESHGNSES